MSKMDALRAMREARYNEMTTRAAKAPATTARVKPPVHPVAAATSVEADDGAGESAALCGHRNMGGRTCTREPGHAAKSHRYS